MPSWRPTKRGVALAGACGAFILALGAIYLDREMGLGSPAALAGRYVDSTACAGCHQDIWESFSETGMARSFAPLTALNAIADFSQRNTFHHAASERDYRMERRDDGYYMRRSQRGLDGREENVFERRIDYVVGSGAKVQTFLSRTEQGELVQLPVAWYAAEGGFWAMNPGYDRPDHAGFQRRIKYDCMFCHNAYPQLPPGQDLFDAEPIVYGELASGIDCQRCHGPGGDHLDALAKEAPAAQIRSSIVNPARLGAERRLEVCLQCHLQSTSLRLPYATVRTGRGVFSYRPGEPLSGYIFHFDHPPGVGYDDKFEIAHAGYRLLGSTCFKHSNGTLTCTSCHDPHRPLSHGKDAAGGYRQVCETCHEAVLRDLVRTGRHTSSSDCVGCHMPQRRTDDVAHVIMTDHKIQRSKPPRDLLAPRREFRETAATAYHGELVQYYPEGPPATPREELDVALAHVIGGTNAERGLPRLAALIAQHQPGETRYYFEVAEAYRRGGDPGKSLTWYEEALRRDPKFLAALRSYGMALAESGQLGRAEAVLREALALSPQDSRTLHNLGTTLLLRGRTADAASHLRQSCRLQPDSAETYNALASALYETGDYRGAEEAFREAIRIKPDYALARANLSRFLAERGDRREAEYQRGKASAAAAVAGSGSEPF